LSFQEAFLVFLERLEPVVFQASLAFLDYKENKGLQVPLGRLGLRERQGPLGLQVSKK
jgi:hypothetical protein